MYDFLECNNNSLNNSFNKDYYQSDDENYSFGEEQKGENFNNYDDNIYWIKGSQKYNQGQLIKNIRDLPTALYTIEALRDKNGNGILFNEKERPLEGILQKDDYYFYTNPNKETDQFTFKDSQNNLLTKRKRGRPGESGDHNKYSDDNLRRKCKHLVLRSLFNFINQKVDEVYGSKIGKGVFTKKLLTLNQKQKSEASIEFNKSFLHKTIGDIFSENISSRYTNFPLTHNKNVVNCLKNDEKESNKNYFRSLFNLTFLDCLKHFRGSEEITSLKGFIGFDSIKENYKEDPEYLESLNYYIMNFEEIINNKRGRKVKRQKI
jgi:hypothetical protein